MTEEETLRVADMEPGDCFRTTLTGRVGIMDGKGSRIVREERFEWLKVVWMDSGPPPEKVHVNLRAEPWPRGGE